MLPLMAMSKDLILIKESKIVSGLTLYAEVVGPQKATAFDAIIRCKLTNESDQPIMFGSPGASNGFSISAMTADGKKVPLSKKGEEKFLRHGVYFKYAVKRLNPGESIEFQMNLAELFDIPKEGIQSIIVGWSRGLNASGGPFEEIKGLDVSLDVRSIRW